MAMPSTVAPQYRRRADDTVLRRQSAYVAALTASGIIAPASVLRVRQRLSSPTPTTRIGSSWLSGRQMATRAFSSAVARRPLTIAAAARRPSLARLSDDASTVLRRQRDYASGLQSSGILSSPPIRGASTSMATPRSPPKRRMSTGTARADAGEVLRRQRDYERGLRASGILAIDTPRSGSRTPTPRSSPSTPSSPVMRTGTARTDTGEVLRRQMAYERGLRASGLLSSPPSSPPRRPGSMPASHPLLPSPPSTSRKGASSPRQHPSPNATIARSPSPSSSLELGLFTIPEHGPFRLRF